MKQPQPFYVTNRELESFAQILADKHHVKPFFIEVINEIARQNRPMVARPVSLRHESILSDDDFAE